MATNKRVSASKFDVKEKIRQKQANLDCLHTNDTRMTLACPYCVLNITDCVIIMLNMSNTARYLGITLTVVNQTIYGRIRNHYHNGFYERPLKLLLATSD